jgi:hypothetical protein
MSSTRKKTKFIGFFLAIVPMEQEARAAQRRRVALV